MAFLHAEYKSDIIKGHFLSLFHLKKEQADISTLHVMVQYNDLLLMCSSDATAWRD